MKNRNRKRPFRPTGGESDLGLDAEPTGEHAPHPRDLDPDDLDTGTRATRLTELDGFLFPGHHCSGEWSGPDD